MVLDPPKAGKMEVMHNLTHVPIQQFAFFRHGIFFLKGFTVVSLQKNYFCGVKNQLWDEKITVNLLRKNEIKKKHEKKIFFVEKQQ
jgi:hypothetical protein